MNIVKRGRDGKRVYPPGATLALQKPEEPPRKHPAGEEQEFWGDLLATADSKPLSSMAALFPLAIPLLTDKDAVASPDPEALCREDNTAAKASPPSVSLPDSSEADRAAEAVLLALAGRWEWYELVPRMDYLNGAFVRQRSLDAVVDDKITYSVIQLSGGWQAINSLSRADSDTFFPDESAAVAACERHHTTGRWE